MKDLSVRKKDLVRDRDWSGILSRYHESGLRIREFSEQEGIPQGTLRDRLGLSSRKKDSLSVPDYNSFIPIDLGGSSLEVELEFRVGTKLSFTVLSQRSRNANG